MNGYSPSLNSKPELNCHSPSLNSQPESSPRGQREAASSYRYVLSHEGKTVDISNLAAPKIGSPGSLYPNIEVTTRTTARLASCCDSLSTWKWQDENVSDGIGRAHSGHSSISISRSITSSSITSSSSISTSSTTTTTTSNSRSIGEEPYPYIRVDLSAQGCPFIEIGDTTVPYIGNASRTKAAIRNSRQDPLGNQTASKLMKVPCCSCEGTLVCMTGMEYVICSNCLTVNPVFYPVAPGRIDCCKPQGVGIGLHNEHALCRAHAKNITLWSPMK